MRDLTILLTITVAESSVESVKLAYYRKLIVQKLFGRETAVGEDELILMITRSESFFLFLYIDFFNGLDFPRGYKCDAEHKSL